MFIALERPADGPAIETLLDRAFGPNRHGRTVYSLRDGVAPAVGLCFTARPATDQPISAVLRFWPVTAGGEPALLLGPLAVDPHFAGQGYGRALMRHGIDAAFDRDWRVIVLVGEAAYYGPFGFSEDAARGLDLPGPMTPGRCLMALTADGEPPRAGTISRAEPEADQAGRRAHG
ncbi:MAG: N-acetyltransferase [Alphaproteobacteria bacterium]|nr:N-acetyltransferase [Alphaproteobacteria bacterium]